MGRTNAKKSQFPNAQRNIAAALVVGNQSFTDQGVTVMVVVVAIIGLVTLMPLAGMFGRRVPGSYAADQDRRP